MWYRECIEFLAGYGVSSYWLGKVFFFLNNNNYVIQVDSAKFLECVWQCGCGCFSNSFSCQNTCQ